MFELNMAISPVFFKRINLILDFHEKLIHWIIGTNSTICAVSTFSRISNGVGLKKYCWPNNINWKKYPFFETWKSFITSHGPGWSKDHIIRPIVCAVVGKWKTTRSKVWCCWISFALHCSFGNATNWTWIYSLSLSVRRNKYLYR